MEYIECAPSLVPMALLLEADPCEDTIRNYLSDSWCFVAIEADTIVGASIVKPVTDDEVELFNIAVLPQFQGQSIGSTLLAFTLSQLKLKGAQRVVLGTGSFGYQLTFYQRAGFRVDSVIKNHF